MFNDETKTWFKGYELHLKQENGTTRRCTPLGSNKPQLGGEEWKPREAAKHAGARLSTRNAWGLGKSRTEHTRAKGETSTELGTRPHN